MIVKGFFYFLWVGFYEIRRNSAHLHKRLIFMRFAPHLAQGAGSMQYKRRDNMRQDFVAQLACAQAVALLHRHICRAIGAIGPEFLMDADKDYTHI